MIALLLQLFTDFFMIGGLSIGGGYAIIPMINEQVVNVREWLTLQEFTNIITISQMTPGPIAVNTSTFVGMKIAGVVGALVATIGCITIGVVISITLYKIFSKYANSKYIEEVLKGLKASSLGLIISAGLLILLMTIFKDSNVSLQTINYGGIVIFLVALVVIRKYQLHPILVMVITGVLGVFVYGI